MTKKRLGHDPFNEEPLSSIRDTRKETPAKAGDVLRLGRRHPGTAEDMKSDFI